MGATLGAILGSFLGKFLDPVAAVLGLALGALSRTWWQLLLAALAIAALVEMILSSIQFTRSFHPMSYLIGVLAAGVWIMLGLKAKQIWARRRSNPAD